MAEKIKDQLDETGANDFEYPTGHWLYRGRQFLFDAKLVLTLLAAGILVGTLIAKF